MLLHCLAYFWGGAFATNALPHLMQGLSGRRFPTPFARPRGVGESSSAVNTVWALVNIAVAYLLLVRVGDFDLRSWPHVAATAAGIVALSCVLSWRFGEQYGGNRPA